MAVLFPDIQPSSRRFAPPRWPTSRQRSQSGVVSPRLWGSKPANGELSLGFNNIRDALAGQIVDVYGSAKGDLFEVQLPDSIFAGATGSLLTSLQALTQQGLRWYFKENDPPSVESVRPGISTVRVNLSLELRVN